ncbi:MAG TPA: 50S ribosomal protein L2 [Candidatus Sumerlaeota bacterium]|nr:MAG: 50S ribosomal protein L2 [candidate division BRC1 bacterium ADurb.BinA292]HOE97222.1 50S ribosomal protein L2 [Candidatus Sumerlaeota bacterium]
MPIKTYKPVTPSRRTMSTVDYSVLTPKEPEKSLTEPLSKKGGRNNTGRISVRRRGGGHPRKYRVIDFKRLKDGVPAKVAAIEYDPNRSAFIALLHYADGAKSYIIAPEGLKVGHKVMSGPGADIAPGNVLPLRLIPVGTTVCCIEMKPGKGAQLARAAGAGVQLMAREGDRATLRMPSSEMRFVHADCRAMIGTVGNSDHGNVSLGKAGRTRWLGRRPKVRGVAMNPVDHPHGGGEGRTSGGRDPVTPWGKPTKGAKTRNARKQSSRDIIRRRRDK